MSTVGWIILIVVIAVVVVGVAVALNGNKRTAAKREEAETLRAEASERTASVEASRREADEQAARAEVARAEAARAEEAALKAQQGVHVEEARVEDQVRAADHVDPDVNTRTDDYRPTTPLDDPSTTGTTSTMGTTSASGTSTYADQDDHTATDVSGRPLDSSSSDPDAPTHLREDDRHRTDPA